MMDRPLPPIDNPARKPRAPSPLPRVLTIALLGSAVGAGYGALAATSPGAHTWLPVARGTLTGGLISLVLASLTIVVLQGPRGSVLRRAPFLLHLVAVSAIYLAIILAGLWIGRALVPLPSDAPGSAISAGDALFSAAVSFVFVFLLDVNRLLGQNVLLNFVTGRYHHPRVEERIFLFIDLEGSTRFAERLGETAFLRLIDRYITDISAPIVAYGGEIHRYLGDEVIATWKLADGVADARCLRACLAAFDALAARAPDYEREFGARAGCRAALHCGSVVTGEVGSIRKEIVFLGDTVNTTARIQESCRTLGERALISADLAGRLRLPEGTALRPLGPLHLRGKQSEIALCALDAAELAGDAS